MKRCGQCLEMKILDDFHLSTKEGRQGYCKGCSARNIREYTHKTRAIVLDAYGGACACCGETIPQFLAIDHVNGGGNKHRRENNLKGGISTYRFLINNNFPKDEFQLLCHNCNVAKGLYGLCPHQVSADTTDVSIPVLESSNASL